MAKAFQSVFTLGLGAIARASNQIVMIAVTLVATRFLGPAEFGVFSLAAAGVTFIRTILHTGPFEYLLKSAEPEAINSACLAINVLLSIGLSLVLILGFEVSEPLFKTESLALIVLWMAPSNVISGVSAWQESQILRAKGLRPYYMVTTGCEIISGLVSVVLLFRGLGVYALVVQLYARTLLLLVGYRLINRPLPLHRLTGERMAEVFQWSRARYSGAVLTFSTVYGADFIIGTLLSPAFTGLYRAGSRVASGMSDLFIQPGSLLAITMCSKKTAAGKDASEPIPSILLVMTVAGWSCLMGLAITAPSLTTTILGPRWAGASIVISILCFARCANILTSVIAPYLVVENKLGTILKSQTVSTTSMIIGLIVTARFGVGAAAATVAVVQWSLCAWLVYVFVRTAPQAWPSLRRTLTYGGIATAATGILAFGAVVLLPAALPFRIYYAIALGIAGWLVALALMRKPLVSALRNFEHA